MYFGWEGGLARYDLATGGSGTVIVSGSAPGGVGNWRALAFDPTGAGGAGSMWVASFSSPLVEVDMTGGLLNTYPNPGSLYGLAYDDSDGNLWGHITGGDVIKIDATTGAVIPGAGWPNGFGVGTAQGGLSGFHDGSGLVAAIMQTAPDQAGVYDSATGNMVMGPWMWETMTTSNGLLGVAVIPEPATLALLGLGALALLRRRS
jgi:hypothetical protein